MGQDYVYIIISLWVSSQCPERQLTFLNCGIGSERVSAVAARWQNDTLDMKPGQGHTPVAEFEQNYDKMLANIVAGCATRPVRPFHPPGRKFEQTMGCGART